MSGKAVWLYWLGLFVLLGGIGWANWIEESETSVVYQLVGADALARRIVWHSPICDETMRLEYRLSNGGSEVVYPTITAYEAEGESGFRYQAELMGLKREADYVYRVVVGAAAGAWHTLSTRANKYRAVIVTDSQCRGDYHVWQETVRAIVEHAGEVALCLHLGDLVDCGASSYQWKRWLEGSAQLLADCAFAPVMGNHEDYDMAWQMSLPNWYRVLFPVRDNTDEELEGYVYSFDYGDVHYAVLDTQAEELAAWKSDWTARQAVWLARDLSTTQAKWKVVLCHKPFGDSDGAMTAQAREWLAICRAYGVCLIVSGHQHIYARRKTDGITVITAGVSGDDVGYEPRQATGNEVIVRCDTANYVTLDVEKERLTLQAVRVDGTVIDTVTIDGQ